MAEATHPTCRLSATSVGYRRVCSRVRRRVGLAGGSRREVVMDMERAGSRGCERGVEVHKMLEHQGPHVFTCVECCCSTVCRARMTFDSRTLTGTPWCDQAFNSSERSAESVMIHPLDTRSPGNEVSGHDPESWPGMCSAIHFRYDGIS